ncbi:MAG TPA: GntR family transcriptional regulator [Ramlibacter sp.]|nr:GntR family transcriptional regulator [Ramlibacter sp.]
MDSTIKFQPPKDVGMQLSASVATHLREQIISGQLKTGDFLRIDAIASELRVSTTPVREGLLLLQSESFVRLLPRRGFVVNSFNKGDLRDIFWAQAIIGAELAARAAQKMTKDDHARLQQLIVDHKKAYDAGDEDSVARLGHQFHRAINLAADSPRLALLLGSLTKQLPNRFYARIEGQLQDTVEYHPIILDAIRVKDSDAVRSLMYRHIMHGGDHLVESLERAGAWGPPQEAANAPTVEPPAKAARKAKPAKAEPAREAPRRSGRVAAPVKAVKAVKAVAGRRR